MYASSQFSVRRRSVAVGVDSWRLVLSGVDELELEWKVKVLVVTSEEYRWLMKMGVGFKLDNGCEGRWKLCKC